MFWSITYWMAIFALLGVISIAFARRGAEDSLSARARQLSALRGLARPPLFALVAIGSGGWYFYNAHVLNEYLNAKARRGIQADYERQFKQYENLLQPKVGGRRQYQHLSRASFLRRQRPLDAAEQNNQAIQQIHVTDQMSRSRMFNSTARSTL